MTRYACPHCGDNTELRVAVITAAWINADGSMTVDPDVNPEIDYGQVAYCDACGWDGPPTGIEDNGPDPDQQLIHKEARDQDSRFEDDGDALVSAGLGTDEDYGG